MIKDEIYQHKRLFKRNLKCFVSQSQELELRKQLQLLSRKKWREAPKTFDISILELVIKSFVFQPYPFTFCFSTLPF